MLYFRSPYSFTGDLGKAYNDEMALIPNNDDWVCFTDGDTMFLSPDYGHQIQEVISTNQTAGIITCLTNRIGNHAQLYGNKISEDPNILNHRKIAIHQARHKRHSVKKILHNISGHCMIIKKSTWLELGGFPENIGILDVDTIFTNTLLKKGKKIICMEGVYIFHFYRMDTGIYYKQHLQNK